MFEAGALVAAPICGWLADRLTSRKGPFLAGMIVQFAAMLLFGFGTRMWMLLVSRILCGMSSGTVWTVGLAFVIHTVEKGATGRCLGFAVSVGDAAIAISPTIGGLLFSKTGIWGLVGLLIALLSIDLTLRLLVIEKTSAGLGSESNKPLSMPVKAKVDVTVSLAEVTDIETGSGAIVEPVSRERHLPPILYLLRSPRVLSACYGMFVSLFIAISFESVLPVFARQEMDLSPSGTGLIFLNLGIPTALGFLQGLLADRLGFGFIALIGTVLTPPSLILLILVGGNSTSQIALLCVLLFLVGRCGGSLIS